MQKNKISKKKHNISTKPPKYIYFIFGAFLLLAFTNIATSVSAQGLKPFGFFENALAAITGRPAPNTKFLAQALASEREIEDQLDRCEIIDPNISSDSGEGFAFASEIANSGLVGSDYNFIGTNIAPIIDNGIESFEVKAAFETNSYINGGYILGMVLNPKSIEGTVEFVQEANRLGMMPIVRMCYPNPGGSAGTGPGCFFNMNSNPQQVTEFFSAVAEQVGSSNELIAMLGPNEPGTAGEMESFGYTLGEYGELINDLNIISETLQDERPDNGGNMYLAQGAFNLSNMINNDVTGILGNNTFKVLGFDYLIGNGYNQTGESVYGDRSLAYGFYDGSNQKIPWNSVPTTEQFERMSFDYFSVRNFIEAINDKHGWNIRYIMTEFGVFEPIINSDGKGRFLDASTDQLNSLQEDFNLLCNDDFVDGVLIFRGYQQLKVNGDFIDVSVGTDGGFNSRGSNAIDLDDVRSLSAQCNKSLKRRSTRDMSWANCNLDSCIYDKYEYSVRSTAQSCASRVDDPDFYDSENSGVFLKADCSGGQCVFRKQNTLQVSLPVRQFGNNASYGTLTKPFTPVCAEVAKFLGDPTIDPLNQFAGKIELINGEDYPIPWLGNGINCAAELLKSSIEYPVYVEGTYEINEHPGSSILSTYEEIRQEYDEGSSKTGVSQFPIESDTGQLLSSKIIDEKAVRVGENQPNALDKGTSQDTLRSLRNYDPFSNRIVTERLNSNYSQSCSTGNIKYDIDETNFMAGPEVLDGEVSEFRPAGLTNNSVCGDYAKRNTDQSNADFMSKGIAVCQYNQTARPYCNRGGFQCENGGVFRFADHVDPSKASSVEAGECIVPRDYLECFEYTGNVVDPADASVKESEVGIYYRFKDDIYGQTPDFDIPGAYDALYTMYLRLNTRMSEQGLKIVFKENVGWRGKVASIVRDANRPVREDLVRPTLYDKELNVDWKGDTETYSCSAPDNIFQNNYYLAKNAPEKIEYKYYDWLGYTDIIQDFMNLFSRSEFEPPRPVSNPYFGNTEVNEILSKREYILENKLSNLTTLFPIPSCDYVEELKYNPEIPLEDRLAPEQYLTCITFANDPRADVSEDLLGQFLCEKGYRVPGLCDEPYLNICKEFSGSDFRLSYPTNVTAISSEYGIVRSYENDDGVLVRDVHRGIDFPVPVGTPVRASANGTVIEAGNNQYAGLYVKIQHDNPEQYVTAYFHNSELKVTKGQKVKQGDIIALAGSTGNSTGSHVHLELRKNPTCTGDTENPGDDGCTLDPEPYLKGGVVVEEEEDVNNEQTGSSEDGGDEEDSDTNEDDFSGLICRATGNEDYEAGVLNCVNDVDASDTSDGVDFNLAKEQIDARIKWYNLDSNQSYSWLGNPLHEESAPVKTALIARFGSEEAYNRDRAQRVSMTEFLIDGAIERGINPRLAYALWVEETAGGAIGGWALGCISTPQIPVGIDKESAVRQHLTDQLDCMKQFVDNTVNFTEFACTYSGEPALPGTEVENRNGVYVRSCDTTNFRNNPNFPANLCKFFNYRIHQYSVDPIL